MEELNQVRWKESYCSNEGLKKMLKKITKEWGLF